MYCSLKRTTFSFSEVFKIMIIIIIIIMIIIIIIIIIIINRIIYH